MVKLKKRKKGFTGKEFVSPKQELREASKFTLKDLLGGSLLSREVVVRQAPFALFLFAMLLFYIGNQYRGSKVMRETMALEERVRELKTRTVSVSFKRQEISRQSEIIKLVRSQGMTLEEALIPPFKIIIDSK